MKKIILIILSFFIISNTSASMYFLDGYYLWKIDWYDLKTNSIKFENYINFYDYINPINDLISWQYKKYNFSEWFLWNDNDKSFVEKNRNEKYVIFYVNNYVWNFLDIFKKQNIPILYIWFIKCDKNWNIYFDTNWKKVFPMPWTEENEEYVREKLWKLNSCNNLEDFFEKDRRFNFWLKKQIDFRIYYLSILFWFLLILFWLFKFLWKK